MQRLFSSRRLALSSMWIRVILLVIAPLGVHAAPATLANGVTLRAERYVDSKMLTRLAKGSAVETLQSQAGWVQVRAGGTVGWLRASQLVGTATAVNAKEDGRSGTGNVLAISGIRSMPRASPNAGMALSDVDRQRDPTRSVSITMRKPVLRVGRDVLNFSVASSHDGYLYLIMLGSDNKSLYLLFPNDLDQDNLIKAGTALQLPRKKWEILAQGPSGVDKMLAVVVESPRDLKTLGSKKAGPFLTMLTDVDGQANLQWLLGTSTSPASNSCRDRPQTAKTDIEQKCGDTFGSTLIDIVEK
jgi:hypothetical protein